MTSELNDLSRLRLVSAVTMVFHAKCFFPLFMQEIPQHTVWFLLTLHMGMRGRDKHYGDLLKIITDMY